MNVLEKLFNQKVRVPLYESAESRLAASVYKEMDGFFQWYSARIGDGRGIPFDIHLLSESGIDLSLVRDRFHPVTRQTQAFTFLAQNILGKKELIIKTPWETTGTQCVVAESGPHVFDLRYKADYGHADGRGVSTQLFGNSKFFTAFVTPEKQLTFMKHFIAVARKNAELYFK